MHIFHSFIQSKPDITRMELFTIYLHLLFLGWTQLRNALHCETDRLQDCKYFLLKIISLSGVLSGVLDKKTWRCHPLGWWYACKIWWKDWNWEKILFVSVEFENKVSFFCKIEQKEYHIIFCVGTSWSQLEWLILKLGLIFNYSNFPFTKSL